MWYMNLCDKCKERLQYSLGVSGEGTCEKHGFQPFGYEKLYETCAECAKEKGICQKCGCDLKTGKMSYYCLGCGKDKTLEEMADPNDCFLPGICKECNLKTKE